MKDNSFLPLGSIVHLKSQQKKLMIIGYLPLDLEQSSLMYDYIGCLYPEGVLATDKNILFNQKDIKEVIKRGYENEEQITYLKNLKEIESTWKRDEKNAE